MLPWISSLEGCWRVTTTDFRSHCVMSAMIAGWFGKSSRVGKTGNIIGGIDDDNEDVVVGRDRDVKLGRVDDAEKLSQCRPLVRKSRWLTTVLGKLAKLLCWVNRYGR